MGRYFSLALIVTFVVLVVILVTFFNGQNEPCPAAGCSTVYVNGAVSTGLGVNPVQIEFKSSSGQIFNAAVTGSAKSNFLYGLSIPNDQVYSVTVTRSVGGSCSAGNLNLNSDHPAYVWNASC